MSKYVISNQLLDNFVFYCRLNEQDNVMELIWNPDYATKFSSKQKAKDFINKYIPQNGISAREKIVLLKGAKTKFNKWVKTIQTGGILNTYNIKSFLSKPYQGENKYKVLQWWIDIHKDDTIDLIDYKHYETWPNLYELFDHIFNVQEYCDTEDYSKKYLSFSIRVNKNSRYQTFKKEIDLILPHITFIDDKNSKIIDIFDRYLSEGGNSVYLHAHTDGKFSVKGRYNTIIEKTILKKCFEYLKRERYYDDGYDDEDVFLEEK